MPDTKSEVHTQQTAKLKGVCGAGYCIPVPKKWYPIPKEDSLGAPDTRSNWAFFTQEPRKLKFIRQKPHRWADKTTKCQNYNIDCHVLFITCLRHSPLVLRTSHFSGKQIFLFHHYCSFHCLIPYPGLSWSELLVFFQSCQDQMYICLENN